MRCVLEGDIPNIVIDIGQWLNSLKRSKFICKEVKAPLTEENIKDSLRKHRALFYEPGVCFGIITKHGCIVSLWVNPDLNKKEWVDKATELLAKMVKFVKKKGVDRVYGFINPSAVEYAEFWIHVSNSSNIKVDIEAGKDEIKEIWGPVEKLSKWLEID